MNIIIEQDEAESRSASEFSAHADLDRVTLLQAIMDRAANLSLLSRPFDIEFDFRPGSASIAEGCANLQVQFGFRATDASGNAVEVIKLDCTLEVSYSLERGYSPKPGETEAFHRANAIFNSWPFFREYVQSSVQRMNMTPPPIPLLRIAVTPGPEPSDVLPTKTEESEARISSTRRSRVSQSRPKAPTGKRRP